MKDNKLINLNVLFFIYIFLTTEILSLFKMINKVSTIMCLLAFFIFSIIYIFKNTKLQKQIELKKLILNNKIMTLEIIVCSILILIMLIIALNTIPFNWDSMTYHLSRIMHWIQNKSVDYYPTNINRQIVSPPMAEYILMNIHLIFDNDILFNILQWYSYAFSAYLIYKICRNFKVNKEIAAFGSIIFLTMNIAIAESVTTQVDLFSGMILLLFIYYTQYFISVDKLEINKNNIFKLLLYASLVGIGYISKSQICLVMLIFLLYLLINRIYKKEKVKNMIIYALIATFTILPFILPSFYRNYKETGDILASEYFSRISIGTYNPKYVFVNILKNYCSSSNNFVYLQANQERAERVVKIAEKMNVDINDDKITFTGDFKSSQNPSYHCDSATVPILMILFMGAFISTIGYVIYSLIKRKNFSEILILIILFLGILINFIIVRWQPWVTRLLIPSYILMCIYIAYTINIFKEFLIKSKILGIFIIGMTIYLVYSANPAIEYNKRKAVTYRQEKNQYAMYFAERRIYKQYVSISNYIKEKNYNIIGLKLGEDTYEFPLWKFIKTSENMLYHINEGINENMDVDCIISIDDGKYTIRRYN